MTVMVQMERVASQARVTTSALRTYVARAERVDEVPLVEMVSGGGAGDLTGVMAVVAGDLRVVEIVLPDDVSCEAVASATWILSGRGWSVDVLVPSHRLGEAHAALRSVPCRLQPWWIDGDEVSFGHHETP